MAFRSDLGSAAQHLCLIVCQLEVKGEASYQTNLEGEEEKPVAVTGQFVGGWKGERGEEDGHWGIWLFYDRDCLK